MDVIEEIRRKVQANGGLKKSKEPECKICNDKGYIFTPTEGIYGQGRDCICKRKKRWYGLLEKEGLLGRYEENTFDTYTVDSESTKKAKEQAIKYANNYQGRSLMITGSIGSGKTHLAMAVANKIAEDEIQTDSLYQILPKMKFFNTLVNELINSKNFTSELNTMEILGKCKDARLLIIDDFLKNDRSPEVVRWMFEIINARYNKKLPTIITSELTPKEILSVDEALGSRLIEMAGGVKDGSNVIILKDKNRRLK